MGLSCPGARTEAFFVHAVPNFQSHPPSDLLSRTSIVSVQLPGPQPCRANAFDQLFVSHFIDSFFGPMKPPPTPSTTPRVWLHELPVFLASLEPPLVKHAIRAASMLSYGNLAGDVSIKMEAGRWYAKALQDLRSLLSSGRISFAESVVCASVMLIHFETQAGTCQRAWLQHVKGAALLIEIGGPERCRSGFMHQIFSHVRFQTFVAAMAENEVPAFASLEWMTIPFQIHPKLIFDRLIDALFAVLSCLSLSTQLIRTWGDNLHESTTRLDTLVRSTMQKIKEWWSECISSGSFGETELMRTRCYEGEFGSSGEFDHLLLPYTNVPEAAIASIYDTANIIILRLLYLVSPSAASYDAHVQRHGQSILCANQFVNATSGPEPDRGSIMMVLQLKVVSLWSSSLQQRDMAASMLNGGKVQNGGLADISVISHEYFAGAAAHILRHYPDE
ncbi:Fc.00g055250.m01.CDS01 [Cosmosporella sp. VM-42]